MSEQPWFTDDMPLDKPSPARMYDYYLGGYHNFAIDRQAAEAMVALGGEVLMAARANRAFLRRAVTFLCEQGIDQFLDIGSGIPTAGNVHTIAQAINPGARIVYVDIDPIAVAHSSLLLKEVSHVCAIRGDVRQTDQILGHPDVRGLLDFSRPVALLLIALLHFVPQDASVVAALDLIRSASAPGSFIAISHGCAPGPDNAAADRARAIYARSTNPLRLRSPEEIQALFTGYDLVEPGLVYIPRWRPEGPDDLMLDQPERTGLMGGVGRIADRR